MTGLVKAKKYDWKDSNLALFGSDTEKQVKKESAECEPAWQGAGQEVGLKIWRIVKFEVTDWPTEDYGKFYNGDSYIILNTYKPDPDSEQLAWDVHFWIGKNSTQDEYTTAAYKTVELDTFMDDGPVQHREVQGRESELFRDYFPKGITIMEGGADTGFRHVTPEEYRTRLLHFSGKGSNITVKEVPRNSSRVSENDVYILDAGLKFFQFNGRNSSGMERMKAAQFLSDLKSERPKAESEVLDQDDTPDSHEFWTTLDEDDDEDEFDMIDEAGEATLLKVSDVTGSCEMTEVKSGGVSLDDFCSSDVFLLDVGNTVFVWVGKNASPDEKKNGFAYAQSHLKNTSHPCVPISVIKEGQSNAAFNAAVAA